MTVQPFQFPPQDERGTVPRQRLFTILEGEIDRALEALDGIAPLMLRMARYHLGIIDASGEPTPDDVRLGVQGKRIRPLLAMHTAEAVGGSAEDAGPVAAAIELLHNFTLIHDDIQDRSPNRRHRPTVWRIWGNAQAINAGDALFAASQLSVSRSQAEPAVVLRILDAFNHTTIDIVRGQVLDLDNEGRQDVTPDDYLTMIHGKTAAIVRFAAWAGAIVGGASDTVADRFAEVGEAIGMGFQLRDDMLGLWGASDDTGKDEADDIRRRKQTLPILILNDRATEEDVERLRALYGAEEVDAEGVQEILAMLDTYDVATTMTKHVEEAHSRAMTALEDALKGSTNPAIDAIEQLITQLSSRTS